MLPGRGDKHKEANSTNWRRQEQIVNVFFSAFVIGLSPLSRLLCVISLCWFCLSLIWSSPDWKSQMIVNNPPPSVSHALHCPKLAPEKSGNTRMDSTQKGIERSSHLWPLLIWSACGISTLLVAHETFHGVTGHSWIQRCHFAAQCPHVLFPKSQLPYKIPGVEASCWFYFSTPSPFLPFCKRMAYLSPNLQFLEW